MASPETEIEVKPTHPETMASDGARAPDSETVLTAKEKDEIIEAQRQLTERVPTVREHFVLGKNSNGCRIDDFNSSTFKSAGPKADRQRRILVEEALEAIKEANKSGSYTHEQADAVVANFMVSASNDLFPCEAIDPLFGISEPEWEEIAGLFNKLSIQGNGEANSEADNLFDQACVGLLVYRTWKILIRTPVGRCVLLAHDAKEIDSIDPDILHSFEAIQHVLAGALVRDELCTRFKEWIGLLPTSKIAENTTLSPKEQKFLISAIDNGYVDWHNSSKGSKQQTVKPKAE